MMKEGMLEVVRGVENVGFAVGLGGEVNLLCRNEGKEERLIICAPNGPSILLGEDDP